MRVAVLLLALLVTGCSWFDRPVVQPAPFKGEPTGADTGSTR